MKETFSRKTLGKMCSLFATAQRVFTFWGGPKCLRVGATFHTSDVNYHGCRLEFLFFRLGSCVLEEEADPWEGQKDFCPSVPNEEIFSDHLNIYLTSLWNKLDDSLKIYFITDLSEIEPWFVFPHQLECPELTPEPGCVQHATVPLSSLRKELGSSWRCLLE